MYLVILSTRHPSEETHFSCLCPLSHPFSLYPQLVAVESRKIISKSRALPSQRYLFLCMEPDCVHHCKKWSIWEYAFIFIRMVNSTTLRSLFSSVWETSHCPCFLSLHPHASISAWAHYYSHAGKVPPWTNGKATWTCGNLDVKHKSRSKYMSLKHLILKSVFVCVCLLDSAKQRPQSKHHYLFMLPPTFWFLKDINAETFTSQIWLFYHCCHKSPQIIT